MSIVEEIRSSPEEGARRLEREYKPGLLALAQRLCTDQGDAEELVNRTIAVAVTNIDSLVSQSALFGWMSQILVGCHAKDVRRKSNDEIVYSNAVPDVADESAEEEIYRNLDHSLLREAVRRLPSEDREVLLLHYFMDIPIAKMAKILAVPIGTVKSRLHYARKVLAAKLGAAVKKPGGKALLIALVLAAFAAVGAAGIAAIRAALSTEKTGKQWFRFQWPRLRLLPPNRWFPMQRPWFQMPRRRLQMPYLQFPMSRLRLQTSNRSNP